MSCLPVETDFGCVGVELLYSFGRFDLDKFAAVDCAEAMGILTMVAVKLILLTRLGRVVLGRRCLVVDEGSRRCAIGSAAAV